MNPLTNGYIVYNRSKLGFNIYSVTIKASSQAKVCHFEAVQEMDVNLEINCPHDTIEDDSFNIRINSENLSFEPPISHTGIQLVNGSTIKQNHIYFFTTKRDAHAFIHVLNQILFDTLQNQIDTFIKRYNQRQQITNTLKDTDFKTYWLASRLLDNSPITYVERAIIRQWKSQYAPEKIELFEQN